MFSEDPSGNPSVQLPFHPPHRDLYLLKGSDQPQPLSVAQGTDGLAGRVAQVAQLPGSGAAQQESSSEQPTASQVRL